MCTSKLKVLEEKGEETINKCLSYCKPSIICSGETVGNDCSSQLENTSFRS